MKHARPLSPADRDRAVARLRTITVGTTVAAIAALGGFASIAAASYRGEATTDAVTAAVTTSGQTTTATTTDQSSATSAPTTAPTVTAAPTVTSMTGSAHASTGGS
jgi:hypothetical protein